MRFLLSVGIAYLCQTKYNCLSTDWRNLISVDLKKNFTVYIVQYRQTQAVFIQRYEHHKHENKWQIVIHGIQIPIDIQIHLGHISDGNITILLVFWKALSTHRVFHLWLHDPVNNSCFSSDEFIYFLIDLRFPRGPRALVSYIRSSRRCTTILTHCCENEVNKIRKRHWNVYQCRSTSVRHTMESFRFQ